MFNRILVSSEILVSLCVCVRYVSSSICYWYCDFVVSIYVCSVYVELINFSCGYMILIRTY